jgi:ABC-type lipoprotein export system ATPase subunit
MSSRSGSTIDAADLAKQLNYEYQSQRGSDHTMAELAGTFGQSMSERLNQLSPGQRRRIFLLRQQRPFMHSTTPARNSSS